MNSIFKFTSCFILLFNFVLLQSSCLEEAYTCIWRNPERTMTKLFPKAKDYKTINIKITKEQLKTIESKVGELLPGQKEVYQYFELVDDKNKMLGYIVAATQKGDYGAIEFVIGLTVEKKINGIYIQRARERDTAFKKKEFLDRFIDKNLDDIIEMENDSKIKKTTGITAVITGAKKELVSLDILGKKEKNKDNK